MAGDIIFFDWGNNGTIDHVGIVESVSGGTVNIMEGNSGMQMVLFGAKEPKLYQLLFMQENQNAVSFDNVFGELDPTAETCIQSIQEEHHMSKAEANRLFENVWIYTFGIGALCATRMCQFSERKLGEMLSTEFQAMMLFVKSKAGETQ